MPTAAHLPKPQLSAGKAAGESAADDAEGRIAGVIDRNALLIVVLTACAAVLASSVRSATGPDTWYSLMAGRLIWNNGLPHHDSVASLTLGRTWVDQEWLGHLGIYGLLAAGGWALALLTGVVGYTAAFAVSAVGARVRGASERAVAIVVLVAFVTSGSNTELRAQTFAYVPVRADAAASARRRPRTVSARLSDAAAARPLGQCARVGPARRSSRRALRSDLGSASGPRPHGPGAGCRGRSRWSSLPWACVLASPYGLALPGYYRRVLGNSAIRRAASRMGKEHARQPARVLRPPGRGDSRRRRRGSSRFSPAVSSRGARHNGRLRLAGGAERDLVRAGDCGDPPEPARCRLAEPRGPSQSQLQSARGGLRPGVRPRRRRVGRGEGRHLGRAEVSAAPRGHREHEPRAPIPGAHILVDEAWADWLLYEDPSLAGRIAYDIRYELLTESELDRILTFQREQGPLWRTVALAVPAARSRPRQRTQAP